MRKRDLILLFSAIGMAAVLALGVFLNSSLPTGSWGLHFREEGTPPLASAGADQLKAYDAAYIGNTSDPVIYLTFDAGYENGSTEKILDALKKHQVRAAFFLVGNYLEKNPDLVRRMVEEGHIVGNHTMRHPDMSKINDEAAFSQELQQPEAIFRGITGKELTLRVNKWDLVKHGTTELKAAVIMVLKDGTVIEGTTHSLTMQELVEYVNDNLGAFSANQILAVKDMLSGYALDWNIANIVNYTSPTASLYYVNEKKAVVADPFV